MMKIRNFIVLAATLCGCAAPKPLPTTQPLATPRDFPGVANFAEISPLLYRGAQPTAGGFELLKRMGIKTIVDLRGKSHRDLIDGMGFKYFQIPSSVSRPDEKQIVQFLRLVRDPQNQPLFVHDDLGGDRAGLYVAAYRMVEQGWAACDVEVELPRFHFDPYWTQILAFLEHLDVDSIRRQLEQPAATQALHS